MEAWLLHLLGLKENRLSEIWAIYAREGRGKTSTVLGMLRMIRDVLGWTTTQTIGDEADVLLVDDLQHFTKRDWSGNKGKALLKFLRTVRTTYTLVIFTAPSIDDLDIAIRESQLLEFVEVLSPGMAVWDELIIVEPEWQEERSWRLKLARDLAKELD